MKVLVVGAWTWSWYQEASARGFAQEGCDVGSFAFFPYLYRWNAARSEPDFLSVRERLQYRLHQGPVVWRMNRDFLRVARTQRPDLVFLYSATLILPGTIRALRRALPGAVIAQYCNDNPFGPHVRPDLFRHLKRAIPDCDAHFVYRHENLRQFTDAGARRVELLRAYFVPEEDFRVEPGPDDAAFANDIVFAGHFEPDWRLGALERLASAGMLPAVFGGGWARVPLPPDSPLTARPPRAPVTGNDYRKAISGAKIALCFLSRINRDTYTRRTFQIPAMGTFQLSEYSDDLASLFREGEEIEFFRSPEELVDKAGFYLRNDAARNRIAAAGQRRVWSDGHDVRSRMRQVLASLRAGR